MISGPLPKQKRQIRKEIRDLIASEYPDWKTRQYLSTNFIIARYKENKKAYPVLSLVHPTVVRRWLHWYLRDVGRVPRNEKASQLVAWELPGGMS